MIGLAKAGFALNTAKNGSVSSVRLIRCGVASAIRGRRSTRDLSLLLVCRVHHSQIPLLTFIYSRRERFAPSSQPFRTSRSHCINCNTLSIEALRPSGFCGSEISCLSPTISTVCDDFVMDAMLKPFLILSRSCGDHG